MTTKQETSQVAIRSNDLVVSEFSQEQKDLLKRSICKDSTDDEFLLFLQVCKRTRLDPFARQIYAVKRYDSKERKNIMGIQTSIDGFRLIAERSGQYAGQVGPFWCGQDGQWKDIWLEKEYPKASKVGVLRNDFKEVCWGVARFDAYVQTYPKDGATQIGPIWKKMPDLMIAKCAESLALRKAFPQDLSGLYTEDEMTQLNPVEDKSIENRIEKGSHPEQRRIPNAAPTSNQWRLGKSEYEILCQAGAAKKWTQQHFSEFAIRSWDKNKINLLTQSEYDQLLEYVKRENPPSIIGAMGV
jgi:phage recombination protein Bet